MGYAPVTLAGLTVSQQQVALVDYAAWIGDGYSVSDLHCPESRVKFTYDVSGDVLEKCLDELRVLRHLPRHCPKHRTRQLLRRRVERHEEEPSYKQTYQYTNHEMPTVRFAGPGVPSNHLGRKHDDRERRCV